MKIPKKIDKMLDRREKLSVEMMHLNTEIDNWLESKGAELTDAEICDAVLTGCMIYTEPWTANKIVREYIEKL